MYEFMRDQLRLAVRHDDPVSTWVHPPVHESAGTK